MNKFVKDPNDPCAHLFGDLELNKSECDPETRFKKKYASIKDITEASAGKEVRIRGRLHNSNQKGKSCFLYLRQTYETMQCVMFVGDTPQITAHMVKYGGKIPKESIVEVVGVPVKPAGPITGCSNQMELQIS